MKFRKKLNKKQSRKNFKKGTRFHKKNLVNSGVMRGGIRL